jgi:hypothetical protein
VALAYGEDAEECRERAKRAAGLVRPERYN